MANTQKARLTAYINDSDGVRAPATAYVLIDPTLTVTAVQSLLTSYLTLVHAASDGGVVGGSIALVSDGDPVGDAPNTPSHVYSGALFDFPVGTTGRKWSFLEPAFKDSLIAGGHPDQTAAAVTNLQNAIGNAEAGGTTTFTSADWTPLGGCTAAFRSVRKHRKALKSKSFVNV